MENISNAKIEKLKADIEKSRTKIAEYQAKLKEQEKLLTTLEDLEIVARFRNQRGNEDLAAKIRSNKQSGSPINEVAGEAGESPPVLADGAGTQKEEAIDDSV